jgi:ABC-type Na+ efflux pump permease subunit
MKRRSSTQKSLNFEDIKQMEYLAMVCFFFFFFYLFSFLLSIFFSHFVHLSNLD